MGDGRTLNILYFTLDDFDSLINYRSINTDLLREFQRHDHNVYVVSPSERKKGYPAHVINENGTVILKPRIGNIQKTNVIEKGISTVTVGALLTGAIKKEFKDIRFDLILYCTPPVTFLSAVEYVKKRDGAKTYLLLKDIFPQNAVDIGLMSKTGLKGLIYRHFRKQEKRLYAISDRIGCMSPANCDYILTHNPEVKARDEESRRNTGRAVVEVCPNCVEVIDKSVDEETRAAIRAKYGIPLDKTVFVYGGNLGKPQGIPFLIECLRKCEDISDAYFLIVGDGTEYHLLKDFVESEKPKNVKLMKRIPKDDYDTMVGACDVGMIFLDHRFTIPNFPSRMLSYMQAKLPVLACTDPNTDIGKVIVDGGFGWWCESDDATAFYSVAEKCNGTDIARIGKGGYKFLNEMYSVQDSYKTVVKEIR